VGIQTGLAATVLAALFLCQTLFFAMASAVTARNEYAGMALRREIEDLRAQTALLRYQINLTESNQRIEEAAARLDLRAAEIVEVDYVALPYPEREPAVQVATSGPGRAAGGLTAALSALAAEVAGSARSRAEASPEEGHRP
jgi:hypothetical protein